MDHLKKRYLRDFLSIMKVFILKYLNASPGLGEDENDISFFMGAMIFWHEQRLWDIRNTIILGLMWLSCIPEVCNLKLRFANCNKQTRPSKLCGFCTYHILIWLFRATRATRVTTGDTRVTRATCAPILQIV